MKKLLNIASVITLLLAFISGLTFFIASYLLGGTAINGQVTYDGYYLGASGELVEVSELIYKYNQMHGLVFIIVLTLAIIIGVVDSLVNKNLRSRSFKDRATFTDYMITTGIVLFFVTLLSLLIISMFMGS